MRIAVFCNEDRMLQVCDNLSKDYQIMICNEETDYENQPAYDAIVFPIKGVYENGMIDFLDKKIQLSDSFFQRQKKECIYFCGMKNEYLERLPQAKIYYMQEEKVIRDNAILTAEGVLHELINCVRKSIYDITIDIIGYGQCGKVIYQMLKNLQLNVRVIRRDCKLEDDFIPLSAWNNCGDVLVHTATGSILDKERIQSWKNKPIIIDIATPDVIDIKTAKEEGIVVLKAKNLPGRFASISAGNIIADFIRETLLNEK